MRTIDKLLILFIILTIAVFSQEKTLKAAAAFNRIDTFTAAGNGNSIITGNLGLGFYRISWTVKGVSAPSACSIRLLGSKDDSTYPTVVIDTQTCTSDGNSVFTASGTSNSYVRLSLDTFTANANTTLSVNVLGYVDLALGSTTNGGTAGVIAAWNTSTSLSSACGSSVTQTCTFKTTTGVGTTDSYSFTGGNNGATTFLTVNKGLAVGSGLILGNRNSVIGSIWAGGIGALTVGNIALSAYDDGNTQLNATAGKNIIFTINDGSAPQGDLEFAAGKLSSVAGDLVINLGDITHRWANIYTSAIHSGASAMTFATSSGDATALTLGTDGSANFPLIATTGNTRYGCFDGSNNLINAAATCIVSSLRFKEKITPLNLGLKTVLKMKPVQFYYKDKSMGEIQQLGFIAEEAAKVDPRLATYDAENQPYSFVYMNYVAVLTNAIKELNAKITRLEKLINERSH